MVSVPYRIRFPFLIPQGDAGAGMVPPNPQIAGGFPHKREIQSAPLNPPLCIPPSESGG
jgi:hypothetical protein